jgi:hypothetical protein
MQIMRLPPCLINRYRIHQMLQRHKRSDDMTRSTLDTSIDGIKAAWGPLNSSLIAACEQRLEDLLRAPVSEEWLAALHAEAPASQELHRDQLHGFLLLAHTEPEGLYRPPHDHGRGWVIYAIQQGEIEMGTYARIETTDGGFNLVKRNTTLVRAGQIQVYLPGDIHDTRCVSGPALLFRFTDRDLKKEDEVAHRVNRYAEREGSWKALVS